VIGLLDEAARPVAAEAPPERAPSVAPAPPLLEVPSQAPEPPDTGSGLHPIVLSFLGVLTGGVGFLLARLIR
jgi:hypothetical protein